MLTRIIRLRVLTAMLSVPLILAYGAASHAAIISPVSVQATPVSVLPGFPAINLINQSGLSAGYTSGVTDFSSVLSGTTHVDPSTPPGSYASFFTTSVNLDFDFGAVVPLTHFALWNDRDNQAVGDFSLFSSTGSTFATLTFLGRFTATMNPPSLGPFLGEVFDMTDISTQFIRMAIHGNHGGILINFGEVAFGEGLGQATPVPEPSTLGLLVAGLLGLGFVRRRRAA